MPNTIISSNRRRRDTEPGRAKEREEKNKRPLLSATPAEGPRQKT